MSVVVDAVYENGTLRLEKPLPFQENARVTVTVQEENLVALNEIESADLPSKNPWVAKVLSFGQLAQGWNGAQAPPPTFGAIVNAARFLFALAEAGQQPTRVAPSAVGGVGITRRVGERKALVEFFNDNTANALFADDATQEMETHAVTITPQGFRDLCGRTREYVNG
jgi:predicted DNA-binding antitoxin AbrB/MazE fold protein